MTCKDCKYHKAQKNVDLSGPCPSPIQDYCHLNPQIVRRSRHTPACRFFEKKKESEEFHCCFCGHVFESLEDSGTHRCPGLIVSENERLGAVK